MKTRLKTCSDQQLVEEFRLTADQVGEAVVNWLPASRITDRLFLIKGALRGRGRAARLKLAGLLEDESRFVRYYAARELYGLLPGRCRPIIEANTQEFDALMGDARGFLRVIDEGTYKPE
jgi:hypothetical protein